MVNNEGQFYTMEGVAAAVMMVVTAYLVLGTTVVYTPGDTHIIDMQLEQVGSDALKIMDTPVNSTAESPLEKQIRTWDNISFKNILLNYLNTTDLPLKDGMDRIEFYADVTYRNHTSGNPDTIDHTHFTHSKIPTGNENYVMVTRWVYLNDSYDLGIASGHRINSDRTQSVLLEVLLWRS